jgi:CheY-like chemotaxis protein
MKAFVIEDHPLDMKLLSVLLRDAGHDLVSWSGIEGALAGIRAQRPDVVLLDLNLSGADGLEIVRAMRANADTRAIPVLAVTAYPQRYSHAEIVDAGCTGIIVKPVDTRQLLGQMQRACASASGNPAHEPADRR